MQPETKKHIHYIVADRRVELAYNGEHDWYTIKAGGYQFEPGKTTLSSEQFEVLEELCRVMKEMQEAE